MHNQTNKTKPEIQACTDEELAKEHRSAARYEQKIRKEIRERRKANTPPGFVPKA